MSIILATQYSHKSQSLWGSRPAGTIIALNQRNQPCKFFLRRKRNIPIVLAKCVFLSISIVDLLHVTQPFNGERILKMSIIRSGSDSRGCKILTNERPIGSHRSPFCFRRWIIFVRLGVFFQSRFTQCNAFLWALWCCTRSTALSWYPSTGCHTSTGTSSSREQVEFYYVNDVSGNMTMEQLQTCYIPQSVVSLVLWRSFTTQRSLILCFISFLSRRI